MLSADEEEKINLISRLFLKYFHWNSTFRYFEVFIKFFKTHSKHFQLFMTLLLLFMTLLLFVDTIQWEPENCGIEDDILAIL